ncbi:MULTISPECIES: phosphatase PAP2 family protein [unclassified Rickettsia]|uniref:phosphatase PAP2 family protein n=1 Tax=unclassified Rickettsia TaxID=114295 RepID=UPI0020A1DEBB|nr:phosphatase PAP2 family protein [Rickettsia endosymbiont of Ceutorhynchus assimilis]
MVEAFYNFHGLNQEIFLFLNRITNIGILPYFLQIISFCFNITNFAVIYILYCIYFYIQLKKIKNLNELHKIYSNDLDNWNVKREVSARSLDKLGEYANSLKFYGADSSKQKSMFWDKYNKLIEIGIVYTIFGLTFTALKFLSNFPRPFCSLALDNFVTITNVQLERCLSSFPSSHAGLAVLVTYFAWSYINLPLKIIMVFVVMLVSLARISLAMHYPADIIYGIIITAIVIVIGKQIYKIFAGNIVRSLGEFIETSI